MKNSKLAIIAIVVFAFTSIVSKAQSSPKISDERKQEMVTQMKLAQEKLQLSDDQKQKFKEVSKKYVEKMKGLRETPEQRKEKLKQIKAIQNEKDADMKSFLTEAQYKTYLELKEEKKGRMKDKRKR